MEDKPLKQAVKYLMMSENILILTHEKMDGDGLGSGLALHKVLDKLNKKVTFLSLDSVPTSLKFLPGSNVVTAEVPVGNDFVITIDLKNTDIDKLKYNRIGDRLNILVTPKNGSISDENISYRRGQSKYDLILILDCGELALLGKVYRDNMDIFYNTVVLNIDHHVSNDYFGKINVVDPTATSTAEIVLSLIDALEASNGQKKLMDEDIATCLLTGITVDTNSFQNQNTSPKAFSISAQLLAAGARQQEIVKHIYKTHDLSTLRLWGKALSNIRFDQDSKIVWTILSRNDFDSVNATDDEVNGLMDELITSAPGSEIALLLREEKDGVYKASLRTMSDSHDADKIAGFFEGGGHKRAAGFKVKGDSMEKVENIVIKKLFDYQFGLMKEKMNEEIVEMEEDKAVKIPDDPATRDFVNRVREASSVGKESSMEVIKNNHKTEAEAKEEGEISETEEAVKVDEDIVAKKEEKIVGDDEEQDTIDELEEVFLASSNGPEEIETEAKDHEQEEKIKEEEKIITDDFELPVVDEHTASQIVPTEELSVNESEEKKDEDNISIKREIIQEESKEEPKMEEEQEEKSNSGYNPNEGSFQIVRKNAVIVPTVDENAKQEEVKQGDNGFLVGQLSINRGSVSNSGQTVSEEPLTVLHVPETREVSIDTPEAEETKVENPEIELPKSNEVSNDISKLEEQVIPEDSKIDKIANPESSNIVINDPVNYQVPGQNEAPKFTPGIHLKLQ